MATNLEAVPIETIESLQKTLTDVKVDIPTRFRSIFTLKAIKSPRAIDALATGLKHIENQKIKRNFVIFGEKEFFLDFKVDF